MIRNVCSGLERTGSDPHPSMCDLGKSYLNSPNCSFLPYNLGTVTPNTWRYCIRVIWNNIWNVFSKEAHTEHLTYYLKRVKSNYLKGEVRGLRISRDPCGHLFFPWWLEFHGCSEAFPPAVAEEAKRAPSDWSDSYAMIVRFCYIYEPSGLILCPLGIWCVKPTSRGHLQSGSTYRTYRTTDTCLTSRVLIFKKSQTFHLAMFKFSCQGLPEVTIWRAQWGEQRSYPWLESMTQTPPIQPRAECLSKHPRHTGPIALFRACPLQGWDIWAWTLQLPGVPHGT